MDGSKYFNSILGKVATILVAVIVISYTVDKCFKLNTVSSVIEYEIKSHLTVSEVYKDYIKADLKPYDYSSLEEYTKTIAI